MKTPLRACLRHHVCSDCKRSLLRSKKRRFTSISTPAPEIYDVVTVGGGPVGLGLLAALKSSPATSHLKVALIESQDLLKARNWELPPDQFSNRASSLTPTSVSFLEDSGAWKHVDQRRVQPYDAMEVWDAANDSSIQFDWRAEARKYNAPPRTVATMTENANLTRGLLARISELDADSSLLSGTSVSSVEHGKDDPDGLNLSTWPTLTLSSTSESSSGTHPSRIAARLLIGADGFNSPVRNFAGISSDGWDYNRHGVVATLTTEPREDDSMSLFQSDNGNQATAFQRFLPSLGGPIALLPLPNNRASMVWSTTTQNAAYLKTLPEDSLVAIINAAFHLSQTDVKYMFTLPKFSPPASVNPEFSHAEELAWRLEHTSHPPSSPTPPFIKSIQPSTLASFPLRFRHASTYTSPRLALIGDAAHTIHPLAGQGLNLGLADARALAATIAYAVEHGQDLGDLMTLERYGRERWGKNLSMAVGVDGLNGLYQLGGDGDGILSALMGRARGVGMSVFGSDLMEGVRGWVMRRAE